MYLTPRRRLLKIDRPHRAPQGVPPTGRVACSVINLSLSTARAQFARTCAADPDELPRAHRKVLLTCRVTGPAPSAYGHASVHCDSGPLAWGHGDLARCVELCSE